MKWPDVSIRFPTIFFASTQRTERVETIHQSTLQQLKILFFTLNMTLSDSLCGKNKDENWFFPIARLEEVETTISSKLCILNNSTLTPIESQRESFFEIKVCFSMFWDSALLFYFLLSAFYHIFASSLHIVTITWRSTWFENCENIMPSCLLSVLIFVLFWLPREIFSLTFYSVCGVVTVVKWFPTFIFTSFYRKLLLWCDSLRSPLM